MPPALPFAKKSKLPTPDLGAPSDLGAPPPGGPGGPPSPPDNQVPPGASDGSEGITLQDMGFRDGSETCSRCQYYDPQGNACQKATAGDTSIGDNPDGAGCHAFKSGEDGQPTGDAQMPGSQSGSAGGAPPMCEGGYGGRR
jgi:hypothetical protein